MSEYLNEEGLTLYDSQIKAYIGAVSGNSTGVRIITLNTAPISGNNGTHQYIIDGTTYEFKAGDEVRVLNGDDPDKNNYQCYKLYDRTESDGVVTVYWGLSGEGGGGDFRGTIKVNLLTLIRNTFGTEPSVVSNTDLNGAIVSVTNITDSDTPITKIWNQSDGQLVFDKLTPLKNYSISVSAGTSLLSKYAAPSSIPIIENLGMGAEVTRNINYTADQYSVIIDSDQDDKTDIANAVVTYNGVNYANGSSIKVPYETVLSDITATTISEPEYKCTITVSATGALTVTAMYELVVNRIDLGLPSGKLWASGNLVKNSNDNYDIGEETDWGTYVSWGNIIGHNESEGYNFDQTTYNSTPGHSVAANIPSNDAAHDIALATLGTPWHLPTKEDFQELYDNTDSEWVADYNGTGVAGRKFMKKTDHSVYVFFPASGGYDGTSLSIRGSIGFYWSSSWYSSSIAYGLYFDSSTVSPQYYNVRRGGFTVRPIYTPHTNVTITLNPTDEGSVNNIQITIIDSDNIEHTATTNSNGVASFTNVGVGSAKVSAQGKGLSPKTISITMSSTSFTLDCVDLEEITGYIINQSNPNAACADMIEMPTVDGAEVAAKDSDDVNSVIHRIWSNTKLYAAATSLSSGKLQIKEVSRTDKTKWADGTSISGTYDYFMKLPEFWWSCSEVSANTDRWNIKFSMDEQTGWNHWEGNTFIGIYKGYIDGTNLYSRRGVTPTVNKSWTDFTTYARNRGTGYSLITYEAHIIMALLGWGWLGTTDDLAIVGRGSSKYPKTTGLCDAKGITDTVAGVDGGAADGSTSGDVSINFWGLENFWGDIYEWVDNLKTADSSGTVNILDTNLSTVKRTVVGTTSYGCIGKMNMGSNGDLIAKSTYSNSNYDTGFGAYGRVSSSAGSIARRSGYGSVAYGGLGYLYVADSASIAGSDVGSRLLYKGDYIETALS